MRIGYGTVLVGAAIGIVTAGIILLATLAATGPSTAELDADMAAIDAELTSAKAAAAQYPGGAIGSQIQLRVQTLQTTRAMLSQKRAAMLRGLTLAYAVNGKSWEAATESQLRQMKADWDDAKARAGRAAAAADAKGGSRGGLIGMFALVSAEAENMTATMMGARYRLAKAGMPILGVSVESNKPSAPSPRVVRDKDAL